jgi:CxxC motif-containing protein (DUF1111 family)
MRGVYRVGICVSASVLALAIGLGARAETTQVSATEALAAFDGASNGFAEEFCANQKALAEVTPDSPAIDADECSFEASAEEFLGPEHVSDGLGPVFNAAGCGECHSAPVLGGSTQVAERRAGFYNGFQFLEHPGGSLLHDRATDASLQEYMIPSRANVFTFRASQSILGDGYVEAIANSTLSAIAAAQPLSMRGQMIQVPVFEKPGMTRTGRFGWKDQQASLLSFAADAYVNEMGITSPLQPTEPTSNGRSVSDYDNVPLGHPNDPDDDGVDVALFAVFMRSTKAPPRDEARAATPDAVAGSAIFNQIGCGVCHTRNIVTAEPGTPLNGGALKVAAALGNKRIHPFGDYLLHDVGTGDGIVQNGGASTRNKVRTAPLWGLRARGRFMHDFLSHSVEDAIQRHDNQAQAARRGYNALSRTDQRRLLAFLSSL